MISLDQKAIKPNFTPSQEKAVDNIISFIAEDFNKLKNVQALSGAAGCGKTFVTNYIIEHSKYGSSMFYLAAPTHKACRILSNATGGRKVTTIQAAFGFRIDTNIEDFDPNLPAFKPIGPPKVANVKVLIVDEASMLNKALVTYINKYCADRKIKVLYIGE
jgi:ATP-dependent exoDNAse (exonuclease V) alpha subunit